jgi:hypothetical protein
MMFLCGLDDDGNPTAINIANARTIIIVADSEGDFIMVEWNETDVSRSVQAKDSVICTPQRVGAVLMSLKERKP